MNQPDRAKHHRTWNEILSMTMVGTVKKRVSNAMVLFGVATVQAQRGTAFLFQTSMSGSRCVSSGRWVSQTIGLSKLKPSRSVPLFSSDNGSGDGTDKAKILVEGLLSATVNRAMTTLSTKDVTDVSTATEPEIEIKTEMSDSPSSKQSSALASVPSSLLASTAKATPSSYSGNPCITNTALAHLKWASVLRPDDSVIDATCGNGHDTAYLASLLFPSNDDTTQLSSSSSSSSSSGQKQLVCIDIQQEACDATHERLVTTMDNYNESSIRIVCGSHATLPEVPTPLGLVCYNLGFLPNSPNRDMYTQTDSTLSSLAEAALRLRVGGLLSVMTYPKTNPNEDYAVHALLEGMALLTSKEIDWRDHLEGLGPDPSVYSQAANTNGKISEEDDSNFESDAYSVRDLVTATLHKIQNEGANKQTWRVMEHKMIGRALSPILLTATRIK